MFGIIVESGETIEELFHFSSPAFLFLFPFEMRFSRFPFLDSFSVTGVLMTSKAVDGIAVLGRSRFVKKVSMTIQTGLLGDCAIPVVHANRFGKAPRCKCPGVIEAVQRLCQILSCKAWRRVTVVALSCLPVQPRYPSGVLLLHDMTVRAGFAPIRKIGVSLRVHEGIEAKSKNQSGHYGQGNEF
jgi:hypothetical protein